MSNDVHTALTLSEHVRELRSTLIRVLITIAFGAILSLVFHRPLINTLTQPLQGISSLVLLNPMEGIVTTFKICLWTGVVATSPLWLFFVLQFISPALHSNEKKIVLPFLTLSILFLFLGCVFAYTTTIPLANKYLNSFNSHIGTNLWSYSQYMNYSLVLLLANGLAFEAAVLLFFVVHLGWISATTLRRWRRHAIVAIFIASAILTPPDILTQLLLAIPLTILYELAILYARLCKKRRDRK